MRARFSLVVLLMAAAPALAHKMSIVPDQTGEELRIEAFYDDDTPAIQARITILKDDQPIAEGRTDEKGVWTHASLPPGTYVIKGESLGHISREPFVVPDPNARPSLVEGSDAPEDRADKTRTPWRRLGLGLGLILGATIMWFILRRSSRRTPPAEPTSRPPRRGEAS